MSDLDGGASDGQKERVANVESTLLRRRNTIGGNEGGDGAGHRGPGDSRMARIGSTVVAIPVGV
jgi:hypothetical protein